LRAAFTIQAAPLRALRDLPQQVWQLDVKSVLREQRRGPQPTAAKAAQAIN
jgi:hypothetical protein